MRPKHPHGDMMLKAPMSRINLEHRTLQFKRAISINFCIPPTIVMEKAKPAPRFIGHAKHLVGISIFHIIAQGIMAG